MRRAGSTIGAVLIRLLCAVFAALLLAASFPLTLPDLPLPAPWGPLPIETPGWIAAAGYGQVPWLAFLALIPLLEVARSSRSDLEACGWGWLAGVLWLIPHWVWLTTFGWLPVVLMSLFYALPVGLFALLARRLIATGRVGQIAWGLPALWVALEYLRSFGFWAYPWSLLGYSQARSIGLIQIADLGGVFAVSFVIALVNVALWLVLTPLARFRPRLGHAFLAAGIVLLTLAYGELRQSMNYARPLGLPLKLALVQGGVGTFERWSEDRMTDTLAAYVAPSDSALVEWDGELESRRAENPGFIGPRRDGELLVVWPESVLPRSMDPRREGRVPYQLQNLLGGHEDAALLLGAIGRPEDDDHAQNGCLLVQPDGEVSWPYSKVRIVPYGEAVPLREVARFLYYPWGSYDLSAGRSAAPLRWRGHCLGLGVCFDNVFSFISRQQVRAGAEGFVLMTNNSWYKLASGVRQHCDFDVLRAVEYRRPVARVSTTGWSHLIAPTGRVVAETGVRSAGLITPALVPAAGSTVYAVVGDVFAQLCLLAALVMSAGVLIAGRSEGLL